MLGEDAERLSASAAQETVVPGGSSAIAAIESSAGSSSTSRIMGVAAQFLGRPFCLCPRLDGGGSDRQQQLHRCAAPGALWMRAVPPDRRARKPQTSWRASRPPRPRSWW